MSKREAQRQQSLLAALTAPQMPAAQALPQGLRETPERALRGVQAYRANAHAVAARALAAAYPTVQMMLGEPAFGSLCSAFWHAHPPVRGDLGEWGDAFPHWLGAQPELAEWPYLEDCARLEHALHACERAADAVFDADSLARLGDTDPSGLQLVLLPGSRLIESSWPIAMIHSAHRRSDDAAFADVRAAIDAQMGESVLVVRDGWRGVCHRVEPVEMEWLRQLAAGADLNTALATADPGFDFAAWLARAISLRWLNAVVVLSA